MFVMDTNYVEEALQTVKLQFRPLKQGIKHGKSGTSFLIGYVTSYSV